MTSACTTSDRATASLPAPSERAMAEETPPPMAPADIICSSMISGNTSERPASGTVPRRPTKYASVMLTADWNATSTMPGAASRSTVGTIGALRRRSMLGSRWGGWGLVTRRA